MRLSEWGQAARNCWQAIPGRFDHVELDAWVVMPNHLRGILIIDDTGRVQVGAQLSTTEGTRSDRTVPVPRRNQPDRLHAAPLQPRRTNVEPGSLGAIVRSYKSSVTKQINRMRGTPGEPFWQRNYWEHIIRSEASLARIREYIETNPARWAEDRLHPDAPPNQFNQWQPSP